MSVEPPSPEPGQAPQHLSATAPTIGTPSASAASAAPEAQPGIYRIVLTKVSSYLIMTQQRRIVVTGSLAELEQAYKSAMVHNLTLGWWGVPFGLIWTPMALYRNAKMIKSARALAASDRAASSQAA